MGIIVFLLFPSHVNASYYCGAKDLSDAQKIANYYGIELQSYKDGIAVFNCEKDFRQDNNMHPNSMALYENYTAKICDVQDVIYKEIEFDNVYKNAITGKGSIVAVIDCGCDVNHFDLRDNIIGGYNSTSNGVGITDNYGHGTHVAGIIAAQDNHKGIVGVAPESKLFIIKASTDLEEPSFYYSDVIRGLNKCVELGYINVVNLSIGGYLNSPLLKEAVENAQRHNILVVCAAGNNSSNRKVYPAAYQIGLSVASSEGDRLANYSSFGENANIVAPGSSVCSTWPDNQFRYLSGTSMSAPLVSGTAALVYSSNKNYSADQVKNILLSNTDGKVYSSDYGSVYGRINLQNIFKVPVIKSPKSPKITIKKNKNTKQQIITIKGNSDVEVYYSINDEYPNQKYTHSIRLDKKGTYVVRFVAVKKGTKAYSNVINEKIKVSKHVYSQDYLKSMKLKYDKKKMQIIIKTTGNKIDYKRVKWISSKPNYATIDIKGNIVLKNNVPKGTKIKFTAQMGTVKKTITIKVK